MPNKPVLVIISGPPATGKTSLGRRLARQFDLPFFHKDGIKETLFDALEYPDEDPARKLGYASALLLYHIAEAILTTVICRTRACIDIYGCRTIAR